MQIFEKLPQISRLRPIVKFSHDPRKTDPQNSWRTPINRKILHALLHYFIRNVRNHHKNWNCEFTVLA